MHPIVSVLVQLAPALVRLFGGSGRKLQKFIAYVQEQIRQMEAVKDMTGAEKREKIWSNLRSAYPAISKQHENLVNELLLAHVRGEGEEPIDDSLALLAESAQCGPVFNFYFAGACREVQDE